MRHRFFAVLLAVTVSALLAENFLHFPLSLPYMKDLAAGAPLLDMRLGYTPEAAYHLFDMLGKKGRGTYLTLLWTIDLSLPALFRSLSFVCDPARSLSCVAIHPTGGGDVRLRREHHDHGSPASLPDA